MKPIKESVAKFNTEQIRNNPEAARVYIEELKASKQELLDAIEFTHRVLYSRQSTDAGLDEVFRRLHLIVGAQ